jgi:hypothetical protein
VVRSALMWLGKADPMASMEVARADDFQRTELRDVITAWGDAIGIGRRYHITISDVIEIAGERLPTGHRTIVARAYYGAWPGSNRLIIFIGFQLALSSRARSFLHGWF